VKVSHLEDRVVMITGAGGGFGALLAEGALARGAKVVALDLDEEAMTRRLGAQDRLITRQVDVRSLSEMKAAVEAAVSAFGAVDILVNNAGTMPLAFYADHEAASEAWDRCIDVNVKGVLHGIIAAYDQMIAQGRGHVVNLSSIYGNSGVVGSGVYSATKAAVNELSNALRLESQGKIKVTVVRPTGVPGTGLGQGVVNPLAIRGILGEHFEGYMNTMQGAQAGQLSQEEMSAASIQYWGLAPEHLVEQILYAMDQPWGIVISDLTVRAANDRYVL
jgi:NADP-dependent 3-hydroxy acid dehydrogenase YdfG